MYLDMIKDRGIFNFAGLDKIIDAVNDEKIKIDE